MPRSSTLIISHKLNLIQRADLILVIDQTGIVESGTHESLMAEGGRYARMREMASESNGILPDAPLIEAVGTGKKVRT